ncbi:MAG: transketolase [Candidatus Hydrogenedentes bacterium]|nr:transketolase [Candidatus Hydrogenedentota bacterium]
MKTYTDAEIADETLIRMASRIRAHVVTMSSRARAPHVASALSCVDILVALYFKVAQIYPADPQRLDRDRIILSKGHACAALYACLSERGYFSIRNLELFAQEGTAFALHPSRKLDYGIEATTGSLGHGLGIGTGMALASQIDGHESKVFVVLSDGECNEGSVWEAAMWAPSKRLFNLVAVVDYNKLQAIGRCSEVTGIDPLPAKWEAFGWDVVEVDGHDLVALVRSLTTTHSTKPRAVIAHTTKGKGVSFMENDIEWHYRPPSEEDLDRALLELGVVL